MSAEYPDCGACPMRQASLAKIIEVFEGHLDQMLA